jgi:hypothetical protein
VTLARNRKTKHLRLPIILPMSLIVVAYALQAVRSCCLLVQSAYTNLSSRLDFALSHPQVEEALVKQLMESRELQGLVDEFYFEHHVNFAPMNGGCLT